MNRPYRTWAGRLTRCSRYNSISRLTWGHRYRWRAVPMKMPLLSTISSHHMVQMMTTHHSLLRAIKDLGATRSWLEQGVATTNASTARAMGMRQARTAPARGRHMQGRALEWIMRTTSNCSSSLKTQAGKLTHWEEANRSSSQCQRQWADQSTWS